MIETMTMRLRAAIEKERAIQQSLEVPYLDPEIRENLDLLSRMYRDHFQTLLEMGLEPEVASEGRRNDMRGSTFLT